MSWVDHIEGTLPADDLRRAFVMGAQWWERETTGATMFQSDRNSAEAKAEELFPGGKVPQPVPTCAICSESDGAHHVEDGGHAPSLR
jgi:hypothetical protein